MVLRIECLLDLARQVVNVGALFASPLEAVEGLCDIRLRGSPGVVLPVRLHYLGQVPGPFRGDDVLFGLVAQGEIEVRLEDEAVTGQL